MFWGLSSALDLYAEYLKAFKLCDEAAGEEQQGQQEQQEPPSELNILIVGGADPRHVIRTLAKRYTHGRQPKLNFFLLDGCPEIIARNMLLLGLALEPSESFSLVCKAHLFMDIYGNSLLRPSSHHYMTAKARSLRNMICDQEQRERLAPMLNIDGLKYKERDGLEMAFSYWQPKEQVFEIQRCWEQRVRNLLGTRYDHREGAFDWDLSMTLKDREAQQICSQEYRYWRECGVAFVFPEYEHCKPNKTLSAGLVRNGRSYLHRGYVGDIQTGPFCGFGLRTSEERMHKSQYGENDFRATDVTERNLLELFHELQTQTVYEHDSTVSRRYGSTKLLMTPLLSYNECDITEGQQSYDKPWIQLPGVEIHFISSLDIMDMQKGTSRWQDTFDIAFVGYNYYTFLSKAFLNVLREESLFVLETKLLTVERREHVQRFERNAKELLKQAGLHPCINYQAINAKNMYLKFKKTQRVVGDGEEVFDESETQQTEEDMGLYVTEIVEERTAEGEKTWKIKDQQKICEGMPQEQEAERPKQEQEEQQKPNEQPEQQPNQQPEEHSKDKLNEQPELQPEQQPEEHSKDRPNAQPEQQLDQQPLEKFAEQPNELQPDQQPEEHSEEQPSEQPEQQSETPTDYQDANSD